MISRFKQSVCFLIACIFLSSCALADKLGFDTYDYMSEEITAVHTPDSDTASLLLPMLDILITDSMELALFESMGDAIDLYREPMLRYMLEKEYAKYSGNTQLIEAAAKEYPELQITQIIPADEFEAAMYEYFGGDVKISHKDGSVFKYLKKVGGYICNMIPQDRGITAEILSVEETAKTYRVRFRCVTQEETSGAYFALIIKREDGTFYFKKLMPAV